MTSSRNAARYGQHFRRYTNCAALLRATVAVPVGHMDRTNGLRLLGQGATGLHREAGLIVLHVEDRDEASQEHVAENRADAALGELIVRIDVEAIRALLCEQIGL